ncbi:MAG: vitamin K epoxide reductase family protein [Anaerolineales bacterium]|nr:vitamin K epoxide reductase family protein [Anaerolineales bacterium]
MITEVLTPLAEKYGDQLLIAGVDVTTADGQALYQAAISRFAIPEDRLGVPTLIIGTTVLVGSEEIPDQLPGLIEQGLAASGILWPDIPGLEDALAPEAAPTAATPAATAAETGATAPDGTGATAPDGTGATAPDGTGATAPDGTDATAPDGIDATAPDSTGPQLALPLAAATSDSVIDKLRRDPAGNALAILFLVGMIAVAIFAIYRIVQARVWSVGAGTLVAGSTRGWRLWAVPVLGLIGLFVSVYMAFIETTHTSAICGPVGDCNTVQQSEYATLFGLIPIGVLGILGYGAILIVWAAMRWGNDRLRPIAATGLLLMALFGVLFSIYLTYLEPFVIGATCMWCLTSALCMTLILLFLVIAKPAPQSKGRHAVPTHGAYAKGHR